jgi:hypothetical protein
MEEKRKKDEERNIKKKRHKERKEKERKKRTSHVENWPRIYSHNFARDDITDRRNNGFFARSSNFDDHLFSDVLGPML